jgi:hypothetical protein
MTRNLFLHALGRPQGETQSAWPPRPTRRRRMLMRIRRRNTKTLVELLPR